MNYAEIVLILLLIQNVHSTPLDIVAGKSGEEQVKEAIDRAEKESEQAAKENIKTVAKAKVETEHFVLKPVDLKETLDKKVEELSKLHEKHKEKQDEDSKVSDKDSSKLTKSESESILAKLVTSNEVSKFTKTDVELAKLAKAGDIKDLSKDTDIKEFIFKETNKDSLKGKVKASNDDAYSVAKENAALEDESDKKMVDMAKKLNNLVLKFQKKMGRLATHSDKSETLISAASQINKDGESTVKSIRGKPMGHVPIDLTALRNALGLAHLKSSPKTEETAGKTSYKEDTKLEDRLAMEAEEEKKFSNGETYDENGDNNEEKEGEKSLASSLSPKEQASQEMQSYNALISSESNRELSQIQEEITKATQSSMGQVSVVGQKETVNTEAPNFQNLGGGFGGSLGALGEIGGVNSGEQFQSLQGAATEGLDGLSGGSEISSQQSSNGPESTGSSQQQVSIEGQQPIEIGGSQEPVEMGTMGSNINPFSSGTQMSVDNMQQSQQFVNGQSPMDLAGQGNDPNISFKKSKITHTKKEILRRERKSKIAKNHSNISHSSSN